MDGKPLDAVHDQRDARSLAAVRALGEFRAVLDAAATMQASSRRRAKRGIPIRCWVGRPMRLISARTSGCGRRGSRRGLGGTNGRAFSQNIPDNPSLRHRWGDQNRPPHRSMTRPVGMSCNARKEANGAQFALAVFWGIAEGLIERPRRMLGGHCSHSRQPRIARSRAGPAQ